MRISSKSRESSEPFKSGGNDRFACAKIDSQPDQSDPDPEGARMPIILSTFVEPAPSRPHMPGYGLPEGPEGLLPWGSAEQRLGSSQNFWVATVRQEGRPHLMIILGVWDGGVFYFSTGSHSRKARNP